MNVPVACTTSGCLAWLSDPIPGSHHDNHCLGESGVLLSADPRNCNRLNNPLYIASVAAITELH